LLKTFSSTNCLPVGQFGHVIWDVGNRALSLQEGRVGYEHGPDQLRQQ